MSLTQDQVVEYVKNISVLDACQALKKTWNDVTLATVQNSFPHSGLIVLYQSG